jgi:hypothetical protein
MAYTAALGMRFWYTFDRRTKYEPALVPVLQAAGAFQIQDTWHTARASGQYPQALRNFVVPRKASWQQLADIQRNTITEVFQADRAALRLAFEDFGQGVLVDDHQERIDNDDAVHMMDTGSAPPVGYHRWHASIRGIEIFDADPLWPTLAQLNALAWAIQSLARPTQGSTPNPPLNADVLAGIRSAWLALSQDQLDRQYDLGSGREGYHPNPTTPAV